jgi:hypothetical protein
MDVILVVLQLAFATAFYFRRRLSMLVGLIGYIAWFAVQIDSWWRPYLFGGRTVGPNWYFARNYKFLPEIDHRPTPDAAHVVLQIALLVAVVTAAFAWHAVRRRTKLPILDGLPKKSAISEH